MFLPSRGPHQQWWSMYKGSTCMGEASEVTSPSLPLALMVQPTSCQWCLVMSVPSTLKSRRSLSLWPAAGDCWHFVVASHSYKGFLRCSDLKVLLTNDTEMKPSEINVSQWVGSVVLSVAVLPEQHQLACHCPAITPVTAAKLNSSFICVLT